MTKNKPTLYNVRMMNDLVPRAVVDYYDNNGDQLGCLQIDLTIGAQLIRFGKTRYGFAKGWSSIFGHFVADPVDPTKYCLKVTEKTSKIFQLPSVITIISPTLMDAYIQLFKIVDEIIEKKRTKL